VNFAPVKPTPGEPGGRRSLCFPEGSKFWWDGRASAVAEVSGEAEGGPVVKYSGAGSAPSFFFFGYFA